MTPARRVFVLLSVYEDLSERESRALRRGDFDFAISLNNRKQRLSQAMQVARQNAELSEDDLAALHQRVRTLEACEKENLSFLSKEMAGTRASISMLNAAAKRTRQVRRGYAGTEGDTSSGSGNMLGCA
ncbi:MAG TPA: hypothetical protein VGA56_08215 [Opitutaceae bacterium]